MLEDQNCQHMMKFQCGIQGETKHNCNNCVINLYNVHHLLLCSIFLPTLKTRENLKYRQEFSTETSGQKHITLSNITGNDETKQVGTEKR